MDQLQDELDASYPQYDIQILGVNQLGHEGGNEDVSEGRDLPWLQDVDSDGDGRSDVWLNSWPYRYRDVVILDADNVPVETFNLTTHDLSQPQNYADLRQLFLDVASAADLQVADDSGETLPETPIDLDVLDNDGRPEDGSLTLVSVTDPSGGTAEIIDLSLPTDLAPIQQTVRPLQISEVRPGEYIELFHTGYAARSLADFDQVLRVGLVERPVSALGAGLVAEPRSYVQLAWPAEFSAGASTLSGELVLLRDEASEADDGSRFDDFVAWGASPAASHLTAARDAGRWTGPPASALANGSLHRVTRTRGDRAESYDTQTGATAGAGADGQVETLTVIRFTPDAGFQGTATFSYTARAEDGRTGSGEVTVEVSDTARPLRNPVDPLDVDADGLRVPLDALLIINALNQGMVGSIPQPLVAPWTGPPFLDCNGNNSVEPADVLQVINALNAAAQGEGEGALDGWNGELAPLNDSFAAADAERGIRLPPAAPPLIAPPPTVLPSEPWSPAVELESGGTSARGDSPIPVPPRPSTARSVTRPAETFRPLSTAARRQVAENHLFAEALDQLLAEDHGRWW